MPARLYLDQPLQPHTALTLPPGVSRHVQVLRLQPGDALTLFNGKGGEWSATITDIGRKDVTIDVGTHNPVDRELSQQVTLVLGMPANDRMDALVEKATELGVGRVQPLVTERSVLRLSGERAERRCEHWQGVAVAAAEQSGRTRVPVIEPVRTLRAWLDGLVVDGTECWMLSFGDDAVALSARAARGAALSRVCVLSGPEGGLAPAEEASALQAGFQRVSLGPRVLRADTAPLAVLAHLAALALG